MDPKLQATYDKVMGTPTSQGTPAAPANPVTASPVTPAAPIAPTTGPVIPTDMTQPAIPAPPAYTADNLSFQAAIQAPATGIQASNPAQHVAKGTSPVLKVLYIVAALVFFVVYTFVWMKIFNIPLPF